MEDLVKPAIKAVLGEDTDINLYPKKFENTYRHWMENIRDWNISRQFGGDNKFLLISMAMEKKILSLQKILKKHWYWQKKNTKCQLTTKDLTQDTDALDTWFSSWLWPMSVFDGIRNPENEEIQYYYPTNDLVTGPDILFFWVARMIIAGYEYKDEKPFQNVYLTGLVETNNDENVQVFGKFSRCLRID